MKSVHHRFSVRNQDVTAFCKNARFMFCYLLLIAKSPKITNHPQEIMDAIPSKPATFFVQATGTEPLSYQWQFKAPGEEDGREKWQVCDTEGSDSASLTIPRVQRLNEGNYRCVVSNIAGNQTSETAQLTIGKKVDMKGSVYKNVTSLFCFVVCS